MQAMVQTLKGFSQVKLAIMAATAILLIAFFVFISLRISSPVMAPLYTNMPVEEGSAIVAELEKQNIPYELRANGTQILAPSDQVLKLRMSMAQKGLPSSGSIVGNEIFDTSEALGTSNFVLNVNKLRALEGELSRTIDSFENIENTRVHLVIPKRELFTRDKEEPTASVALKLRGSSELDKEEVSAIRHLISTAVPGLKVQRITIVDNKGRLLAKGVDKESDPGVFAEEAEQYRVNYEQRMRDTVERLLEQSLGTGKVKAEVNAEIDFDRIVKNSERFDPEGQVARSIQEVTEVEKSNEKSVDDNVSVQNNLPDPNAQKAGTQNQSETNRNEGTTNFEISKETTNQIRETGTVKRLSVAVLVDGTYTTDANGAQVYQPRSKEELDKLEGLVRSSVGYSADRGDDIQIVNMQFVDNAGAIEEVGPLDWLKNDAGAIIQTLVLGVVAILAILMVIRPLVSRAIEAAELAQQEEEMELEALGGPAMGRLADLSSEGEEEDMINIDRIQGKIKSSTFRKINDLIEKHPEETLTIIRQWSFSDGG